jgi:hypothetical protein
MVPMVPERAREIKKARIEAGLDTKVRHFPPGIPEVTTLEPGKFIQQGRHLLAQL